MNKIYVVTHKIVDLNLPKLYELILVGKHDDENIKMLQDNTGDNIAKKNENYSELTALYWMWKNSKADIIGLCHYRRFLTKNIISSNPKYYLNEEDINKIFKKYNMILPQKYIYRHQLKDYLNFVPNKKDMEILRNVIERVEPDYIKDYDNMLKSHYAYLYNMIVTKKKILDEYCEWLFNILFETEKVMDKEDYIHDKLRMRIFGFLSERLFNVWIIHNKDKLKIKEYPVVKTDEKAWYRLVLYIKLKIKGIMGGKNV